MRHARLSLCLMILSWSISAFAKPLDPVLAKLAVSAVVKVGCVNADGKPIGSGSGTVIDTRGYVLTNFHVVGNVQTGRLHNQKNTVLLGLVKSSRESVKYSWKGRVVRADPRLDLALVRITHDLRDRPVGSHIFPTLAVASSDHLEPGSPVWVVGFPAGVRSVNMTAGTIAGFEMNLANRVAWLRTDAEINPGNSGGMLIDNQGRLVGIPTQVRIADRRQVVETIGFARPADRIPPLWLAKMRGGHINDVIITGQFEMKDGQGLHDVVVGDQMALGDGERRFYVLPKKRPGLVQTNVSTRLALFAPKAKQAIRTGIKTIEVKASDPHPLLLAMIFPQRSLTEPKAFWILFNGQNEILANLEALERGLAALERQQEDASQSGPKGILTQPVQAPNTFDVKGQIVDAVSGKPLDGVFLIGRPGQDIRITMRAFDNGRLQKADLNKKASIFKSDAARGFSVRNIPSKNAPYTAMAAATGYRRVFFTLSPTTTSNTVDVGLIKLSK